MTLLESILMAPDELSLEEIGAFWVMVQNANSSGAMQVSEDELRADYRKTFSKRPSREAFGEMLETLVEKGLVPSREAIYPPPRQEGMSDDQRERLARAIDSLENSVHKVRPHPERKDHMRVFGALTAGNLLTGVATRESHAERDPETGLFVVAEGAKVVRKENMWDYGLVGKWIHQYGVDHVTQTICRMVSSGLPDPTKLPEDFLGRRKAIRAYITRVLDSGKVTSEYDAYERDDIITYQP